MSNFCSILGYTISCYSKQKSASSCQLINRRPIIHVLIGRVFQPGPMCFFVRVRTRILWIGNCPHPNCDGKMGFKNPSTFYSLPNPFVICRIVILGKIQFVHSILQPSCWFKPCAVSQVRRVKCIIC